jgi:hypothetical protein
MTNRFTFVLRLCTTRMANHAPYPPEMTPQSGPRSKRLLRRVSFVVIALSLVGLTACRGTTHIGKNERKRLDAMRTEPVLKFVAEGTMPTTEILEGRAASQNGWPWGESKYPGHLAVFRTFSSPPDVRTAAIEYAKAMLSTGMESIYLSCFHEVDAPDRRHYSVTGARTAAGVGYGIEVTVVSKEVHVDVNTTVRASKPKKDDASNAIEPTTTSCDDVTVADLQ